MIAKGSSKKGRVKRINIIVEVPNRELDNALLLKCELENRGYQVRILGKMEQISWKRCDLLLIPNCYTTENYEFYKYRFHCTTNKIISMQYEQVLSKRIEQIGYHNPKGKAKLVRQLCWGSNAYERLKQNGVDKDNLEIVGAIQLDYLRTEFSPFWRTKKELSEKYSITYYKKWLLFISSFSYVDNEKVYQSFDKDFDKEFVRDFKYVSTESQKMILHWFEQLLAAQDTDFIILYRPHPMEANSRKIKELLSKYPKSFLCVPQLSVKQWIIASDLVTTWFSTAIVECFMNHKNCFILRPCEIPLEEDSAIYRGGTFIQTYENLKESISLYNSLDFPIKKEIIQEYYDIRQIPAYKRIADAVEHLDQLEDTYELGYTGKRIALLWKKKIVMKDFIKAIYKFFYKYFHFSIQNERVRNKFFIEDWENYADNDINDKAEINTKMQILKEIIKGYE